MKYAFIRYFDAKYTELLQAIEITSFESGDKAIRHVQVKKNTSLGDTADSYIFPFCVDQMRYIPCYIFDII